MRPLKITQEAVYGTWIRSQAYMDQKYLTSLTRNIIGELRITSKDLEENPHIKDFSFRVFQSVLQHISEWNSETLGRILAFGLSKGETSGDIPLRTTSLEEAWIGESFSVLQKFNGGRMIEWLTTTVLVASIYDLLSVEALEEHCIKKAEKGKEHSNPVSKLPSDLP